MEDEFLDNVNGEERNNNDEQKNQNKKIRNPFTPITDVFYPLYLTADKDKKTQYKEIPIMIQNQNPNIRDKIPATRTSDIRIDEVPLLMYGHPSPTEESGGQSN